MKTLTIPITVTGEIVNSMRKKNEALSERERGSILKLVSSPAGGGSAFNLEGGSIIDWGC